MNGAILIVEDEETFRRSLSRLLEKDGHVVVTAGNVADGVRLFQESRPDVVLLDYMLPDGNGIDALKRMKEIDPGITVVLMTAFGSIEAAVAAMKAGALDYITKSADVIAEVRLRVAKALRMTSLEDEIEYRRRNEEGARGEIIGESTALRGVLGRIDEVAKSKETTVLIRGESGTGKELVARSIHEQSEGKNAPFVAIDCAAIPGTLLESELFGYERGAFSGADRTKRGLLDLARGGTIFLDEIGEMEIRLQSKLLRVLEEKRFRRVGGVRDIEMSSRIVAATNRNLADMVAEGNFREDLYYRLSVFEVVLPPLRVRGEDVVRLAQHFSHQFARKLGKEVNGFTREAEDFLRNYEFPGNVRELRNMIERAVIMLAGDMIHSDLLAAIPSQEAGAVAALSPHAVVITLGEISLQDAERQLVERALALSDNNKKRAAQMLGISRFALLRRLEKYAELDEAAPPADRKTGSG